MDVTEYYSSCYMCSLWEQLKVMDIYIEEHAEEIQILIVMNGFWFQPSVHTEQSLLTSKWKYWELTEYILMSVQ